MKLWDPLKPATRTADETEQYFTPMPIHDCTPTQSCDIHRLGPTDFISNDEVPNMNSVKMVEIVACCVYILFSIAHLWMMYNKGMICPVLSSNSYVQTLKHTHLFLQLFSNPAEAQQSLPALGSLAGKRGL
jgi:hypothetical protein